MAEYQKMLKVEMPMHKIRLLNEDTMNKIATGKVIERPVSMSREKFKSFIDKQIPLKESPINKAIDLYNKTPLWIKSLSNFDPTGITSYIVDIIDAEIAKLDNEKNFEILFQFYEGITYLDNKIDKLDSELDERIIELTRAYFHYSKIAFHKELIIHFRNVWCNCILNKNDNLDEQIFMFYLLSSLSINHIELLRRLNSSYRSDTRDGVRDGMRGTLAIDAMSSELGLGIDYTRTLCLNLVGKGLLIDANVNALGKRAYFFSINPYFERFLGYVLQEQESQTLSSDPL